MAEAWKTVPVRPTAEMAHACTRMLEGWIERKGSLRTDDFWQAWLLAAPPAPEHPAITILRKLEWSRLATDYRPGFCPICAGHKDFGGHSPDCELKNVIGEEAAAGNRRTLP